MISVKARQIQNSLASKDYREALAIEHVNTTLALQIRKMRENLKWSQSDLAGHLNKHQETISQWENSDYGRYSLTTLKALATTFDVALLVKFIPFSELVKDMVSLSETRLCPPSFNEEQKNILPLISLDFDLIDTKDADVYKPNSNNVPSPSTVERELAYVA